MVIRALLVGIGVAVAVVGWTPRQGQRPVFRAETDVVSVVTAVYRGRQPVDGLTASDFALTDNGVLQEIAQVSSEALPVDVSLRLTEAVHERWVALLESMSDDDYRRTLIHPESGEWTLEEFLAMYAWHSRHHTAHITSLRDRMGW